MNFPSIECIFTLFIEIKKIQNWNVNWIKQNLNFDCNKECCSFDTELTISMLIWVDFIIEIIWPLIKVLIRFSSNEFNWNWKLKCRWERESDVGLYIRGMGGLWGFSLSLSLSLLVKFYITINIWRRAACKYWSNRDSQSRAPIYIYWASILINAFLLIQAANHLFEVGWMHRMQPDERVGGQMNRIHQILLSFFRLCPPTVVLNWNGPFNLTHIYSPTFKLCTFYYLIEVMKFFYWIVYINCAIHIKHLISTEIIRRCVFIVLLISFLVNTNPYNENVSLELLTNTTTVITCITAEFCSLTFSNG